MANFYAQYPASSGGSANASVGPNGALAPTSSTEVGGINPSGNLQPLQTDAAGNLLVNLNAETGAPLHVIVDSSALPTGAATSANQTTEIASLSTIAANQTNGTQETQVVGTLPLPTGASTSALQTSGNATLTAIDANQTNGTQVTQITGTIPLPTGAATAALQTSGNTSLSDIDSKTPALGQALAAASTPVVLTAAQITALTPLTSVTVTQATGTNLHAVIDNFPATQPISAVSLPLPTGASNSVAQGSTTAGETGTLIQGAVTTNAPTYSNAQTSPISLTTTGDVRVSETSAASSAITSVSGSATSVQLLAANVARKNAAFYNDSTAILYLKLGTTASTTSYTVQLVAGAYYELPVNKIYTGEVDGIWASAAGACRITELT